MKKIVLASNNEHKLKEFKELLNGYELVMLKDIGFTAEIEETGATSEANAKLKANAVAVFCRENGLDYAVIADDSGLFVNALRGAPGVHSARYAGDHDDEANRQKVLKELEGRFDRMASFECVICYIDGSVIRTFVGRTYGEITTKKIGDESFGYDCIFYSSDLKKTFGQASEEEKNTVSHRGRAIEKLKSYLDSKNPNFDRTLVFNKK